MDHADVLKRLFHHSEQKRKLEAELLTGPDKPGLVAALDSAMTQIQRESEPTAAGQLSVIAGLWGRVATETGADRLAELLHNPDDEVRQAAAEALAELAVEEFDLFQRAAHKILATTSTHGPELEELALLLTDVDHEGTLIVLLEMLTHQEPAVVAAGLEVAGEWGWEKRVAEQLEKLTRDKRPAVIYDEEEGEVTLSIGEIASEVIEALRSLERNIG